MIGQSSPTDPQDAFARVIADLNTRIANVERAAGLVPTSVPNASTSATSLNTNNAIVARNGTGGFAAGTITAALTGNASTATTLQTARTINSVSFDGSANITVPAAAGTLTGTTLAAGVTASSLTSVGTLASLSVTGTATAATFSGAHSGSGASLTGIPNSATTATSANTASAIVARDASGDAILNTLTAAGNLYGKGGYIGRAAAGFGPFAADNRAPALLSGQGTNWIHFDYSSGVFRMFVDSTQVKTFVIDHPSDPDKYLVHACAEGPTADVFYRGEGQTVNGQCWIELPSYFESLTEGRGRTVMITPITEQDADPGTCANLGTSAVVDGRFKVSVVGGSMNPAQRFYWRVDAIRAETSFAVEPDKASTAIAGDGPYTYVVQGPAN